MTAETDGEYGNPATRVGRVHVTTTRWRLGDPYPGTTSRSMTLLGITSEVVEVETTTRTRVVESTSTSPEQEGA